MRTVEEIVSRSVEDCVYIKRQLLETSLKVIIRVAEEVIGACRKGNKILWFGNGGSAADAQHLSCELVGRLHAQRKALPSIALTTNTSLLTAVANDADFSEVFSRQVEALVNPGDVVIGISTSGDSPNVVRGIEEAKRRKAVTVSLTGATGGKLQGIVDYLIAVPSTDTARIQESHIMIGHIICELAERELVDESAQKQPRRL